MDTASGALFGRYRLLEPIAAGGMGEIHLAKLEGPGGFEKLLAIKRLLPQVAHDHELVQMFFSEARLAAKLSHRNIVQIYEMGQIGDECFLAMEYVQGRTLREILARLQETERSLPRQHVITIAEQLCDALSYAHNARDSEGKPLNLIHRDVSPRNVLVSFHGEIKLIDFGIAKSALSDHATQAGTIKGKVGYMSPEQASGRKVDKRSDIFAVGICIYEMCTLTNPFWRTEHALIYDALQRFAPAALASHDPALAVLDPILERALAKDVNARYADCADMLRDLRGLRDSGALAAPSPALATFLQELFRPEIEGDKTTILETPSEDVFNDATVEVGSVVMPSAEPSQSKPAQPHKAEPEGPSRWARVGQAIQQDLWPLRLRTAIAILVVVGMSVGGSIGLHALGAKRASARAPDAPNVRPLPDPRSATTSQADPLNPVVGEVRPPAVVPDPTSPEVRPDAGVRPPEVPTAPADNPVGVTDNGGEVTSGDEPGVGADGSTKHQKVPGPTDTKGAPVLGRLSIVATPAVAISHRGAKLKRGLRLTANTGTIRIGTGRDPEQDPFVVKLTYRLTATSITYKIESEPWAVVQTDDGLGFGKTPVMGLESRGNTNLVLANPKTGGTLRLGLRFSR